MNFITTKPIIPEAFFALKPLPSCGALATFFGLVRDHNAGRVVKNLRYDCYFSMANRQIGRLRDHALREWSLSDARILHRVGLLEVGDIAVAIVASSSHRAEAFEACRFLIESIKTKVPIWKKEFFLDGSSEWVRCGHLEEEACIPSQD